MGIASMVLGIVALVVAIFGGAISWLGIILGIVGIILGALAKKNGASGVATAGLVMSIIATALAFVVWLACAACVASAGSAFGSLL